MAGGVLARSAHFALHRLLPDAQGSLVAGPAHAAGVCLAAPGVWLGALAPKRWARRAVTRNAIRRQVYAVGALFAARLAPAAYVLRLRCAFARQQFVSAASEPLRQAVRAELLQLFEQAALAPGEPGKAGVR